MEGRNNKEGRQKKPKLPFTIFGDQDLLLIKSMRVFNRWGTMVYQGEDLAPDESFTTWDSRLKTGQLAPNGVYIYSISLLMEDGGLRQLEGPLTLMR